MRVYMYVRVCVYTYIYSVFSVIEKVFRLKSTGKREVKKKKAAKIYCLGVILLLMDINMKNDSEREIGGRGFKCVETSGGQVGLTGRLNGIRSLAYA